MRITSTVFSMMVKELKDGMTSILKDGVASVVKDEVASIFRENMRKMTEHHSRLAITGSGVIKTAVAFHIPYSRTLAISRRESRQEVVST